MIIGTDSPACERLKSGIGNRTVLLNTSSSDFVLLRMPTHQELQGLLRNFRLEQAAWLRKLMTSNTADIDGRKSAGNDIYGATTYSYGRGAGIFRFFRADALPADALAVLRRAPPRHGDREISRILNLPSSDARRFVEIAMGDTIDSMVKVLKADSTNVFLLPGLESKLEAQGVEPFLGWVADYCAENFWTEGRKPTQRASQVPFLLMLFLHRNGFVLFPMDAVRKQWLYLAIPDTLWLTDRRKRLYLESLKSVEVVSRGYGGQRPSTRAGTVVRQILLRSTISDESDVSAELQEKLYDYETWDAKAGLAKRISSLSNKVMRAWSAKVGLQLAVERSRDLVGRDLFGWTYDPIQHPLPPGAPRNYRPNPLIIAWAQSLQIAIGRANHKWVHDLRAAANSWMAYLLTLEQPPGTLQEVVRSRHISSSDRRIHTLLSFIDGYSVQNETKNKRVLYLEQLFRSLIDASGESFDNPIVYELDRFKTVGRRGKTPRTPLSREMLGYIKEFNRRDGAVFSEVSDRLSPAIRKQLGYERFAGVGRYAFSRGVDQHHFEHKDQKTGQLRKVWWPGVAVLLELLLEVPIRGFQARFLDSGEADELAVDHRALKQVLNPSPTAQKSRQQGIFYIAEDLRLQPILGLFINSNKTGISRSGGYQIPWCPETLAESLPWLIDWNREYGNTGECPIAEKLNYQMIQNPVVRSLVGTTNMIFRDPITNDGWPCAKTRLSAYWLLVLAAVERELKAQGFRYDLTRTIEKENGETELEALFDIHTLRVSGITAMIEAGMPAELVQEVVGHASVVMTFYYSRVRAALLNDRLRDLRKGVPDAIDPADIPELQIENIEDLLLQLTNRRGPDDAIGAAMLRANPSGLGNGSFNIFPDGICPGGECSTGGEILGAGYAAVPRHRACPLCRYRLTGPMFLAGLVHNANRLMYELRTIGHQICDLVQTAKDLEEQGKSARIVRNQIDGLYRQTEDVSIEWSAEVQYVHAAIALLQEEANTNGISKKARVPALLSAESFGDIGVRLESKPDFVLLQRIAEGADLLPGFRPNLAALNDHREFLNHVLDQNSIEPFLLRLEGPMRDRAALLLGQAVVSLVPEHRLEDLKDGAAKLSDFGPLVQQLAQEMADQVARSQRVEFAALRGVKN